MKTFQNIVQDKVNFLWILLEFYVQKPAQTMITLDSKGHIEFVIECIFYFSTPVYNTWRGEV